jgi:hypothetical protein
MPTTQKLQQKHTKATQKVGGSTKKPVTKVVGGGKVASPMKTKTVKEGGGMGLYDDTKKRSMRNEYLIKILLHNIYKYVVFFKENGEMESELKLDDYIKNQQNIDLSKFNDVLNGILTAQFMARQK